jgi:hypothetical protein
MTLTSSNGSLTLPANTCLSYAPGPNAVELSACANDESDNTIERQVCAGIGLVVSYQNSAQGGAFAVEPWSWDDPLFSDGWTQFESAATAPTIQQAYVYGFEFEGGSSQISDHFPGVGGGTVSVSNAQLAYYIGDSGHVHVQGSSLPLSNGASLSFSLEFGISVAASVGVATGGAGAGTVPSASSCNPSACSNYETSCAGGATGVPVQADCYCAAACDCACAGDSSCANSNASSAAELGTTCSYQ